MIYLQRWINKKYFNFQGDQIIFHKIQRKNYILYHNYKIIIYSHALHGSTTIYISCIITFIVATLLLNHISGPIIHIFPTLSLIFNFFFFLLISQITCPLLSTLISLFLYPFIFHYFWLFLFPSSYYKFTIFSPILCIVFLHTKSFFPLSLSLSQFIPFFRFLFLFLFLFSLHLYFKLMNFYII